MLDREGKVHTCPQVTGKRAEGWLLSPADLPPHLLHADSASPGLWIPNVDRLPCQCLMAAGAE